MHAPTLAAEFFVDLVISMGKAVQSQPGTIRSVKIQLVLT